MRRGNSSMNFRDMTLACVLTASAASSQTVPPGDVVGVGNFIHVVSNLDKSIEFYHDVLGMDLQRAPGAQVPAGRRPFLSAPEVPRLYNAVGAQYRVLSALVPESPMRAELVEFKDVDRRAVRPRVQDPGASILVLTVRDLAPVMARVKKSTAMVVTAGGDPVQLGDGSYAVLVSDPDGFFVELVQRNPAPASKAPADSNFIDVGFTFVVSDSSRMVRVFKDALGFDLQTGPFATDRSLEKLAGIRGMQVRRTTTTVPGTSFHVEFLEFKGRDRKPVHSRLQDPGSAVLRLVVRDVDASVKRLEASDVKVASAGGEVISLPGGNTTIRAAITSAPDNLFVQVLQAPTPPAR
jgi:catechol 2,3-dioxygenase-like lactoylglutathione lyase family enzyme